MVEEAVSRTPEDTADADVRPARDPVGRGRTTDGRSYVVRYEADAASAVRLVTERRRL